MVAVANIRDSTVAVQIHELQRAAYAVEARLIGAGEFPPLRESAADLLECRDNFLVFVAEGNILGCLSYESAGMVVTISRLVVNPSHFRRRIATALLQELERRLPTGSVIQASTAELNGPAIKAYESQGYKKAANPRPTAEGILICCLHKQVGS
jgi:ribosomal protein S18 acetylase RimI-like enzyme